MIKAFVEPAKCASSVAEESAEAAWREVTLRFMRVFGEMLFCFKHPDFHEEREWRLVTSLPRFARTPYGHPDPPSYRAARGNVIPYVSVSFHEAVQASMDDSRGLAFPFSEVVIGPQSIPISTSSRSAVCSRRSIPIVCQRFHPPESHSAGSSSSPARSRQCYAQVGTRPKRVG